MTEARKRYEAWVKSVTDEQTRSALAQMTEEEIGERFSYDLSFGTGGMRGKLGIGTSCLNLYTVRRATAGVADVLRQSGGKRAVLCYDSRKMSAEFACAAAEVLAANGIFAEITDTLMPTPYLSFSVRFRRADVGIMITASHNPAEYNGYKVYGPDGCQITQEAAEEISRKIALRDAFCVERMPFDEGIRTGNIAYLPEETKEAYLSAAEAQELDRAEGLSVTYTPLNGTGIRCVPELLKRAGVQNLFLVEEQKDPDGNFPTCPVPNPEKDSALNLGLKEAKRNGSDLLLATDPDADRVGVAVLQNGDYVRLTGNEVGALLTDYILTRLFKTGSMPSRPVLIKTIVTTELGSRIAKAHGVEVLNVLTGFKYIGEEIGRLERDGRSGDFVFGFEESCGYLRGTMVRDKDAMVACLLICGMAARLKKQGKTLVDRLEELYEQFGRFEHRLLTYAFEGVEGMRLKQQKLSALRQEAPVFGEDLKIAETVDYLIPQGTLPASDVLRYDFEGGEQAIVRPSGTEPLIKVYLTSARRTSAENKRILDAMQSVFDRRFGG